MPEISVIVPIYNAEKYLNKCIDSIFAQTFTDFELILIDDGSTDNSPKICDEYAKNDRRVVVAHKENGGVSEARNYGIEISKGKYIMFCDSDDFVDTNWCYSLYSSLNGNLDFGICGYKRCDTNDKILDEDNLFEAFANQTDCKKSDFFRLYMLNLMNMPWNKIYKSSIIKNNQIFFDTKMQYNEDLLFVLNYIQNLNSDFALVKTPLYFYRTGVAGSLTNKFVDDFWSIKKKVFASIRKTLVNCSIDFNSISNDYYSKYNWSIAMAIGNNYLSNYSNKQIYKLNKEIIKSEECKISFKKGKFTGVSKLYEIILRTRNTMLISLYNIFSKLKRNL